jgi:hypothetical protein
MSSKQELLQEVDVISDLKSSLFGQEFRNEYGSIRWGKVRSQFLMGNIILPDALDIFEEWYKDAEYIVMRGTRNYIQETLFFNPETLEYPSHVYPDSYPEHVYRFIKASKRGNDVYQYLVKKRLKPLEDLPDVTFFKDNWGEKNTSLLFITHTYNTNRCDEATAWKNIGKEFHLFYTKLRQEYGDIEYFRTWESTGHYYPHIHIIIAFKEKSFPVFVHTDKDGHRSFRIPQTDKDKIASFWHSHVDVQGVDNTKDAIDELTKYVTKDLCSDKGNKTNAMICLFRRQSYAITRGFVSLIKNNFSKVTEENDIEDVGTFDLIKDEMYNCNSDFYNWEFIGILRGIRLRISSEIWVCDLKKPPPSLIDLIVHEQKRWRENHSFSGSSSWGYA